MFFLQAADDNYDSSAAHVSSQYFLPTFSHRLACLCYPLLLLYEVLVARVLLLGKHDLQGS